MRRSTTLAVTPAGRAMSVRAKEWLPNATDVWIFDKKSSNLRSTVNTQFAKNRVDVVLDRRNTQVKLLRNLLVCRTSSQQHGYLDLTRR